MIWPIAVTFRCWKTCGKQRKPKNRKVQFCVKLVYQLPYWITNNGEDCSCVSWKKAKSRLWLLPSTKITWYISFAVLGAFRLWTTKGSRGYMGSTWPTKLKSPFTLNLVLLMNKDFCVLYIYRVIAPSERWKFFAAPLEWKFKICILESDLVLEDTYSFQLSFQNM